MQQERLHIQMESQVSHTDIYNNHPTVVLYGVWSRSYNTCLLSTIRTESLSAVNNAMSRHSLSVYKAMESAILPVVLRTVSMFCLQSMSTSKMSPEETRRVAASSEMLMSKNRSDGMPQARGGRPQFHTTQNASRLHCNIEHSKPVDNHGQKKHLV